MTEVTIFTDGACEPKNPGGIATYGFIIYKDGEPVDHGKGVVETGPDATNNLAEYTAPRRALELLKEKDIDSDQVTVKTDSQLVVKQVRGEWRVKSQSIREPYQELMKVIRSLDTNFRMQWVPREENERADSLSKQAVKAYLKNNSFFVNGHSVKRCRKCGGWLVARDGEYGKFYGCSNYPDCKNTRQIEGESS